MGMSPNFNFCSTSYVCACHFSLNVNQHSLIIIIGPGKSQDYSSHEGLQCSSQPARALWVDTRARKQRNRNHPVHEHSSNRFSTENFTFICTPHLLHDHLYLLQFDICSRNNVNLVAFGPRCWYPCTPCTTSARYSNWYQLTHLSVFKSNVSVRVISQNPNKCLKRVPAT